ncbi:MAG: sigma 54-interacting transcriptional regulator [Myxococcales bacterium]|nr:sigma 54-interacting transcriptional regulator [Myxococcales bacterium]
MAHPPDASTGVHRGPDRPAFGPRRAALVCAFPRALAVALPDSGTVVGRVWLAERGLPDTEVSASHLRLSRKGGVLGVADVGSRNGTWVNGVRLRPDELVSLADGAVLRFGQSVFVVREGLLGPFDPAGPVGDLVGPFGLRAVAATLEGLRVAHPGNVLIEGETGTGKEHLAFAVATALGRAEPYGAVNVAGLPAGVFESQLFGHVAGAFSGARTAAKGVIAAHAGGTVFFDEIGELAWELQAKLLRLLDNREILPVGAERPVRADVLVVAATNRALEDMVEAGTFRSDLYARLAQARLHLPPLRERREDVFAIAQALVRRTGGELALGAVEVEAVERLVLEPWPRNVRELASALDAARRVDPVPGLRLWALEEVLGAAPAHGDRPALTEEVVAATVEAAGGTLTEAARRLGVSRGKLLRSRKRPGPKS